MNPEPRDLKPEVYSLLETVHDPELKLPITRLGMVGKIEIGPRRITLELELTSPGCPAADHLKRLATQTLEPLGRAVEVRLVLMSAVKRARLKELLGKCKRHNPFMDPISTRVLAITSGKGGVGKSTIVANLAAGLSQVSRVAVLDADIHGFSQPALFGLGSNIRLAQVDGLIQPPEVRGVKLISIGMFLRDKKPVAWRGPMLHRTLNQFLCEVNFENPDYLLVDLPPGTGDAAISIAQLLPKAQVIVVTTPQALAAEVAIRSGQLAQTCGQKLLGVIENMTSVTLGSGELLEVFGSGGADEVAANLSRNHQPVPVIGRIPLSRNLRESSDLGRPLLFNPDPKDKAVQALEGICALILTHAPSQKGPAG